MDIHRCRFVPFPSSAINAVAFSHGAEHRAKNLPVRLAVGRANGDIEIWNPAKGAWHQEVIIHGGKDRSLDGLVWVTDPTETLDNGREAPGKCRLFSIGYTPTVTEWDLERGRPKRHASGQHGDIWCLAAQPPPRPAKTNGVSHKKGHGQNDNPRISKLVGGTADGSLVLYSVKDDDLVFEKIIVHTTKKRVQMICMAFQNDNMGVVGCSDSTIRVFDMRRSAVTRLLTMGSDLKGGSKEIIVWSVKCLPSGDIVSGDSTGEIRIWDGRTYTLAQRIDAHDQDVLSLTLAFDGSAIVSGGMDRRVALYKKDRSTARWSKVVDRRYHEHDVKAIASFEYGAMSIVVSGGKS
jgi:U3 small nucleolar RNA-associated protein 4